MTEISASLVASLRSRTGVSILECKKALEEAGGDEEKAIDILRKKGAAAAAKKADREQSEGMVFAAESENAAAIVRLDCETDFVARDENFSALGNEIAQSLLNDGLEAAQKLAEEKIPALVQKLGENISLGEMQRIESSVPGVYVHSNGKIGVVVGLSGGDLEKAKDVAMHAAAMNPLYIRPEEVEESTVERERDIWKQQLASEGKPEEIMAKIMEGKEKKFREEHALLTQAFVKDPSMTVAAFVGDADVTEYIRLSVS